ncbi:MAG TPA: hypothetical protein VMX16_05545 [Terriglobia bacterium]|nr:hypothetical protein [Terriglobia bacterium]
MTDTELIERLKKLERDNRRFKRLALAGLVLAAAFAAVYATRPVAQTITAHEFDVVDNSGNVRVSMNVVAGAPSIALHGAKGEVWLTILPDWPGITLVNLRGGAGRVQIGVAASGAPCVKLVDAQGDVVAQMAVSASGSPNIQLSDAKGQVHAQMAVSPQGSPSIKIFDAHGFGVDLGSTQTFVPKTGEAQQTSAASIVMFGNDKKHHVIWKAP